MSCQNCDLPLIPGEPNCGNCGFPTPAENTREAPKAAVAFPSVATVYLAEQPYKGGAGRSVPQEPVLGSIMADSGPALRAQPVPPGGPAQAPGGPAAPALPAGPSPIGQALGDVSLTGHRPAAFAGTGRWLMSAATRNRRGMVAALLAAWSNLPVAVFMAVVGLVSGAVAGYEGTTPQALDLPDPGRLLPLGTLEAGGTAGALGGALLGALQGFAGGLAGPWWSMFDGNAALVVAAVAGQLLGGLVLGACYLLVTVALEGPLLRARGARRPSRREADLIIPIMNEAAEFMRIEGRPAVLVRDSGSAKAFAGARHIVIDRGLLEEFNYDREVVAGVLAHLLTHWNNADALVTVLARGAALPLSLLHAAAAAVMKAFPHPLVRLLVWAAGWPVLLLVRYLVVPLQGADQRRAEYRADQGAVLARGNDGLRRFLVQAGSTVEGGRCGWDDAVARTHPPVELRLEALEEHGKPYRLPDHEALPRPLPIEIVRGNGRGRR